MDRVCLVADKPLDTLVRVAIGVYLGGGHVGLLHRASEKEQPQLLHLLAHRVCRNSAAEKKCVLWVQPNLAIEKANQVVALARLVYRVNSGFDGVPYGFSPYTGYFNPKGEIRPKAAGWGLTCATFVLALFDLAGVQLVLGDSWPEREEDREWQRKMIRDTEAAKPPYAASTAHVKGMKADIGEKRFKPLEVAGAAAADKYPVSFPVADALASQIRAILQKADGSVAPVIPTNVPASAAPNDTDRIELPLPEAENRPS